MTTTELKELRGMLESQLSELEDGSRSRDVLAVEVTPDELNRIQPASEHDLAVGSLQRSESQLLEVQRALRRIRDGSFGICVNCEDEIGPKHLKAVPWAPYCVACQQDAALCGELYRDEVDDPRGLAA